MMISLRPGQIMERDELLARLVEDRYERNDVAFGRNMFRVRGDTVELYPAYYKDKAVRVEFFGDEIERITAEASVLVPSFIREPEPNCFSIWRRAASKAFIFSDMSVGMFISTDILATFIFLPYIL